MKIEEPSVAAGMSSASDRFGAFLARLSGKDRSNVDRHLGVCDREPAADHANLWKRLAALLSGLSPLRVRTAGYRVVTFFVADGAFQRQSFALEDFGNGHVTLYACDALDESIEAKILKGPRGPVGQTTTYGITGEEGPGLQIESLTASGTTSAPEYFRHMLGWNRRAVRIVLPSRATAAQIRAVEDYCARAARKITDSVTGR